VNRGRVAGAGVDDERQVSGAVDWSVELEPGTKDKIKLVKLVGKTGKPIVFLSHVFQMQDPETQREILLANKLFNTK